MAIEPKPFDAALARAVLADCEAALHVLKGNPRGVYWRLAWCSALTLLRAVGHVLEYEMRSPDAVPEMREAWRAWWKRVGDAKADHPIFWDFIRNDRNALLKEYRFTAEQGIIIQGALNTVPLGSVPLNGNVAEPTYLMKDGPFAGCDQRDLVQKAIAWWDRQLEEIALRAAAECMIEKRPGAAPA